MAQPSLKITHVATGLSAELTSFKITDFQDALSTNYNKETVFGRMDPIMTYQNTTRKISLGLRKGPMGTESIIRATHDFISKVMRMQYPVYEEGANSLTLSRPPLVRVEFGNYIRSGAGHGLLCAMNGFAYTPQVGFTPTDSPLVRFGADRSVPGTAADSGTSLEFLPKNITIKFDLDVLHEETMGFMAGNAPTEVVDYYLPNADGMTKFIGGQHFGPHSDGNAKAQKNYVASTKAKPTAEPGEGPAEQEAADSEEAP